MAAPSPAPAASPLRTRAWVYATGLALSLLLHLGAAAPYAAWTHVTRDLDTPGDEGPEDAPVGNDGGELVGLATPVRVSVYDKPRKSRPKTTAPAVAAPEPAPEPVAEAAPAGGAPREGVQGKPPRGNKKPCEQIEEVVQVGEDRWRVERDLLDWYAGHLRELEKQAGVASHRGPDGKRNGARLYLPRCSVLKQGGLRNGDIIHTVNGHKVNTVPQAVATYLKVRNDRVVTVELTRKGGEQRTHKYVLK